MRSNRVHRRLRNGIAAIISVLAMLILTSCQADDPAPQSDSSAQQILAAHGLEGMDARAVITELDALPIEERSSELFASIRPDELVLVASDELEASLPMPDDEFYVSIAPYVTQTHECHFHSLTTCLGELRGVDLQVTVTENATGEILIDQELQTYDNGFFGLWLPRDIEATITVAQDGRAASTVLSTSSAEDATCVTTMQLV